MTARRNPAWTNTLLAKQWDALERVVGADLMPRLGETSTRKKLVAMEFGTGHYGTVMPTRTADVVLKITSDPSEARFVAITQTMTDLPSGLVNYLRVLEIPGTFRRRSVYAIWRQEATDVGEILHTASRDAHAFHTRLTLFNYCGVVVRNTLLRAKDPVRLALAAAKRAHTIRPDEDTINDPRGGFERLKRRYQNSRDTEAKLAAFLAVGLETTEMMTNEAFAYTIGETLGAFLHAGLYLADVHAGNLGRITHPEHDKPIVAITDPGHMVVLTDHYDAVRVPELGGF